MKDSDYLYNAIIPKEIWFTPQAFCRNIDYIIQMLQLGRNITILQDRFPWRDGWLNVVECDVYGRPKRA